MFHKWSSEEDHELRRLVLLYATDWHKIQDTFSSKRSRNALIKRWHTKLKNMADAATETRSDHQMIEEQKSPLTDNTTGGKPHFEGDVEGQNARIWDEGDDVRLRGLVVDDHEYDWRVIAEKLDVSEMEAQQRWEKRIYPVIKSLRKIAGALMWTKEEDEIIFHAIKKSNFKWERLLAFLPGRSYFSLEARWKRISTRCHFVRKSGDQNPQKTDHRAKNHLLRLREYKNILKLRKSPLQRLTEHSQKSDSDPSN